MSDIYGFLTITDENNFFALEANINYGKAQEEYYMPNLIFKTIKSKEYPNQDLMWDGGYFIFNDFYNFLHRWKNRQILPEDIKEFGEVADILEEDNVDTLIKILDKGIQLGWDKL